MRKYKLENVCYTFLVGCEYDFILLNLMSSMDFNDDIRGIIFFEYHLYLSKL